MLAGTLVFSESSVGGGATPKLTQILAGRTQFPHIHLDPGLWFLADCSQSAPSVLCQKDISMRWLSKFFVKKTFPWGDSPLVPLERGRHSKKGQLGNSKSFWMLLWNLHLSTFALFHLWQELLGRAILKGRELYMMWTTRKWDSLRILLEDVCTEYSAETKIRAGKTLNVRPVRSRF